MKNLHAGEDDGDEQDGNSHFQLLILELDPGQDPDQPIAGHDRGWFAAPSRRFERLLRETGVGIGLLCNGDSIRLLCGPAGSHCTTTRRDRSGRLISSSSASGRCPMVVPARPVGHR